MKKFFPLLILLLTTIYTFAQTVTETQMTLISKRTADWCPFCGTYGWSFSTKLAEKSIGKDVIFWSVHHSGGLATPTSTAMASNLGGIGQPIFFVNSDIDLEVTSSNVDKKVNEAIELIDDLSSLGSLVSMGSKATLKNSELTVDTKVLFPSVAESGEYYVGTYLVKKNLVWTQASVGPNAIHQSVLDKSLTPSHFGTKITGAPVNANAEFTTSAKLDQLVLHNGKLEDTKIVTILWNKLASGKYVFLNAREVPIELDNTSSVEDQSTDWDFSVQNQGQTVIVDINSNSDNPMISLFDVNGRDIMFNISKSADQFQLDNIQAVPGMYIIQVVDGNNIKTKQCWINP